MTQCERSLVSGPWSMSYLVLPVSSRKTHLPSASAPARADSDVCFGGLRLQTDPGPNGWTRWRTAASRSPSWETCVQQCSPYQSLGAVFFFSFSAPPMTAQTAPSAPLSCCARLSGQSPGLYRIFRPQLDGEHIASSFPSQSPRVPVGPIAGLLRMALIQ